MNKASTITSTITKEKIAEELKMQLGFSLSLCEEIISNVFSEIISLAHKDQKLMLKNFGTWKVNNKKARPGFNIQSGEKILIAPRTVLRFSPSQSFKNLINDEK